MGCQSAIEEQTTEEPVRPPIKNTKTNTNAQINTNKYNTNVDANTQWGKYKYIEWQTT